MLNISRNLQLPIAGVTQTFAFLGKRGGGKTYAASKLAEEMLAIGAQIMVLDVVGTWYGLRVPKGPKGKAFDILVFGGLNGDIEINPKAGKIVAGIILEKNLSAVVDISQFIHSEQTRFAYDFLITLFEGRKARPGACHIFLEEAQELVPQNLPPGGDNFAGKMLHAGERVVKLGRNFGIGCSLISQRPQEVNKKVLNQTEVLLAFQMTGIQEKKTIREWVKDKGDETDVEQLLPKLETGEALIWSPTWLKISGTYRISQKATADVSATPEVGAESVKGQSLAPVDVAELRNSIASLTQELEANTPVALKKRIVDLEKDLMNARKLVSPAAVPARVEPEVQIKEIPVLKDSQLNKADQIIKGIDRHIEQIENKLQEFRDLRDVFVDGVKTVTASAAQMPAEGRALAAKSRSLMPFGTLDLNKGTLSPNLLDKAIKGPVIVNPGISGAQQRVLDSLALCERLGIENPERVNVAFFAGYTVNGHFNNLVGGLRAVGLVDYPQGGRLCLTDQGRALGNADSSPIGSLQDFHQLWLAKLGGPEQKILSFLLQHHGEPVAREDLAAGTGYTVNGHFNNCVGHLKTLGAAYYPQGGYVAASKVMFPEGLQ